MKNTLRIGGGFCVVAVAVVIQGCIAVGGTSRNTTPTVGRELIDLKMALDQGAINQAEYDQARGRLLAR